MAMTDKERLEKYGLKKEMRHFLDEYNV